jgi:hypothetical protein
VLAACRSWGREGEAHFVEALHGELPPATVTVWRRLSASAPEGCFLIAVPATRGCAFLPLASVSEVMHVRRSIACVTVTCWGPPSPHTCKADGHLAGRTAAGRPVSRPMGIPAPRRHYPDAFAVRSTAADLLGACGDSTPRLRGTIKTIQRRISNARRPHAPSGAHRNFALCALAVMGRVQATRFPRPAFYASSRSSDEVGELRRATGAGHRVLQPTYRQNSKASPGASTHKSAWITTRRPRLGVVGWRNLISPVARLASIGRGLSSLGVLSRSWGLHQAHAALL